MSGEIKKIDLIRNMAVFQNFQWSTFVRDNGNNVAEFKKINIIYGRNYSGKTTLSRIFRALEMGCISDKYKSPEFVLSFEGCSNVTQNLIRNHNHVIRVFNEDFVKENLRFIIDENQPIKSFAILGENNAQLEEVINQHELDLGNEENESGLIGKMLKARLEFDVCKKKYEEKVKDIESRLRDKANNGIKHNKEFGEANYNITKINDDIDVISKSDFVRIDDIVVNVYRNLIKEEAKNSISELSLFDLKYSDFMLNSRILVEKKIHISQPIQDLLNNAALESWVRQGREYHKDKRTQCAFCGNDLSLDLWEKLDNHFNKESENLRSEIDSLLDKIDREKERIPKILNIEKSKFYHEFHSALEKLEEQFSEKSNIYCDELEKIRSQLEKRKNNISSDFELLESGYTGRDLNDLHEEYECLRGQSNKYTQSLNEQKSKARTELRLNEVLTFVVDIKYFDECLIRDELKNEKEKFEKEYLLAEENVEYKKNIINELKAQLKDESKGAEKVNDYLNNFFGHKFISLQAIEENLDDISIGYRFEIMRNGEKAFHLSEGECSLIAFCYFMAKLDDVDTRGNEPIIWIDDPISSLDSNHVFFIYGLINSEIMIPDKFKQIFISTHSLDFLKYIKKLDGAFAKKTAEYFIVNRVGESSYISLMPKYLKYYVTEFNFLFHQLHKCANADIVNDDNFSVYYNFGNNARKFLEAFLYYKYPNAKEKDGEKLSRFFGDDVLASTITDRINNEYSHLAGVFERSVLPIDVPEMKATANFILKKMEEKDPDQYSALLESIGEK